MTRLEFSNTKDREKRNIPICNELYEMLLSLPSKLRSSKKDTRAFQFRGRSFRDMCTGLKKACEKAKIKYGGFEKNGFIFHDHRLSFNRNVWKDSVPESVIMKITDRSTREMFDKYNPVDEEDTQQAVNQLQYYLRDYDQNQKKFDMPVCE